MPRRPQWMGAESGLPARSRPIRPPTWPTAAAPVTGLSGTASAGWSPVPSAPAPGRSDKGRHCASWPWAATSTRSWPGISFFHLAPADQAGDVRHSYASHAGTRGGADVHLGPRGQVRRLASPRGAPDLFTPAWTPTATGLAAGAASISPNWPLAPEDPDCAGHSVWWRVCARASGIGGVDPPTGGQRGQRRFPGGPFPLTAEPTASTILARPSGWVSLARSLSEDRTPPPASTDGNRRRSAPPRRLAPGPAASALAQVGRRSRPAHRAKRVAGRRGFHPRQVHSHLGHRVVPGRPG